MKIDDVCADIARLHGEVVVLDCKRAVAPGDEIPAVSCLAIEQGRVAACRPLVVRVDPDALCLPCRLSWHLAQAEAAALAIRGPVELPHRWVVFHCVGKRKATWQRLGEVEANGERVAWSKAWSRWPGKHLEVVRSDDAPRLAEVEAHGRAPA